MRSSQGWIGADGIFWGLGLHPGMGHKSGRKWKMTDSKIESAKSLLASGFPPSDVAKNLGGAVPTLYRWVPASSHP